MRVRIHLTAPTSGKRIEARIGASWCQVMHDNLSWPVNGHYTCMTCLRKHPVEWEKARLHSARMRP